MSAWWSQFPAHESSHSMVSIHAVLELDRREACRRQRRRLTTDDRRAKKIDVWHINASRSSLTSARHHACTLHEWAALAAGGSDATVSNAH
eukprot:6440191-Prymnesium_polylepis.1